MPLLALSEFFELRVQGILESRRDTSRIDNCRHCPGSNGKFGHMYVISIGNKI